MREMTQDSKRERKREGRWRREKNQGKGVHFTRYTADNSALVDIYKVSVWNPLLGHINANLSWKKIVPYLKGYTSSKLSKRYLQMVFFLLCENSRMMQAKLE